MADGEKYYMSEKTFNDLKDTLTYLKGGKREEIIRRIDTARGFGDLSENAEYDEARREQRENESDILFKENLLENSVVYKANESCDKVQIGHQVNVICLWNDKEIEYRIVGSIEADPLTHRISNSSPIGQALLEKSVGDVVEVQVPAGIREYKITGIKVPD